MTKSKTFAALAFVVAFQPSTAISQGRTIEDFTSNPETRWSFFADTVMGGKSAGRAQFLQNTDTDFAKLSGTVSTANNGGFIQMRANFSENPPENSTGIRIIVRGNSQRYFIHLRTRGTIMPWQYYQVGFDAPADWSEIRLPFIEFAPSGSMMRTEINPQSLRSIGIVAFGRDHDANLEISEVGYY